MLHHVRDEDLADKDGLLARDSLEQRATPLFLYNLRRYWLTKRVVLMLAAAVVALFLLSSSQVRGQLPSRSSFKRPLAGGRDWTSFDNYFAFGDSYTSYHLDNRHSSPPYLCKITRDGDRFVRKPNWITFMTEVYNSSTITAVNFAEGGSTVDRTLVPPFAMGSSLKEEVAKFTANYAGDTPALPWQPARSLFLFWFGVNDMTMNHMRSPAGGEMYRPPLPEIFESYSMSINTLYHAGARNFLFMTVPPFDRSLSVGKDDWHARRQFVTITDITAFNARMFDMLYDFRRNHSDIEASIFEAHRFYSRVLDDPTHFPGTVGVTNTTGICNEAKDDLQPGPLDVVYEQNICKDGNLIQSYAWTPLHSTYPMHNATGLQVIEDCFGAGGPKGYCS